MNETIIINYGGMFVGVGILILLVTVASTMQMRKSKKYRKFLTDMYVAAKIRFLAKADDLDIELENDNYKAWCKKEKLSNRDYDLDNTVEEELIEKISALDTKPKKAK